MSLPGEEITLSIEAAIDLLVFDDRDQTVTKVIAALDECQLYWESHTDDPEASERLAVIANSRRRLR